MIFAFHITLINENINYGEWRTEMKTDTSSHSTPTYTLIGINIYETKYSRIRNTTRSLEHLQSQRVVISKYKCNINVVACILVILSVFVFCSFSVLVIGNNLIKRNYLITSYYYRLNAKCNLLITYIVYWYYFDYVVLRSVLFCFLQ